MKPTSSYRMSKQNKWLVARELNSHVRGALKRSIIDSDLSAQVKIKDKKDKDSSSEG